MLRRTITLTGHLTAALLPMLAGWGFSGLDKFFSDPARADLVMGILVGAGTLLFLDLDLNPLRTKERDRDQNLLLILLAVASVTLLWWLPFADRRGISVFHCSWVRWLGLALCTAGGLIRVHALRRLGPQFSAYVTLQPGHELVDTGIYARIRHPLYLSLLLAGPGLALVFRSPLVWPILAASLVFALNRISLEESLLATHFGARFSAYRERTWALIPRIY